MGPISNDRRALLRPIGWNDKGHVHVGVSGVRLGVVGHDKLVSVGTAFEVCAAFLMVSLDAIISVPSSVSIALSAICVLASVFSLPTRHTCTPSVAVNSFRYQFVTGFGVSVRSVATKSLSRPGSSEGRLAVLTSVDWVCGRLSASSSVEWV